MEEKKSFVLYTDYGQHIRLLSMEERGELITALFDYVEDPERVPTLSGAAAMAFSFIRIQIDRDQERWQEIRQSRAEAGRKGAESTNQNKPAKPGKGRQNPAKVGKTRQRSANPAVNVNVNDNVNVIHTPPLPPSSEDSKAENVQEEAEKHVQFAEFVSMTNAQYAALVAKVGEHGANRCIEILDNYKGQTGKTYKSDYRAILNWAIDRYREEQAKEKPQHRRNTSYDLAELDKMGFNIPNFSEEESP